MLKSLRTLMVLSLISLGWGQTNPLELKPQAFTAKQFPSLVPISIVRVPLDVFGTDSKKWPGGLSEPGSYIVTDTKTHQKLIVSRVDHPDDSSILAYLIMQNGLSAGQAFSVQIVKNGKIIATTKSDATVEGPDGIYSFQVNPQAAPAEQLRNGKKRDVGQFGLKLDVPELLRSFTRARTYLSTDNLISTDEKDNKSKLDGKLGVERSITGVWYLPVHVETEVQGDQVASNLSFLLGSGIKTVLPWAATKSALYNGEFQIPLSPTFNFEIQYERRINQDAASKLKFPGQNGMRLHEQNSWNPIRLLPGWLNDRAPWLELNGQAWYLPLEQDKTGKGHPRLEGAGDVSLLIPTAVIPFVTYLQGNTGAHTRIRLKYSAGADETSGFKHSHQFTAGIELAK
jgi:hypothetical protein